MTQNTSSIAPTARDSETALGGGLAAYMDAVASNDVDRLRRAGSLVAPDSPAGIYVKHLANLAQADVDGGDSSLGPQRVSGGSGSFELCYSHGRCLAYTDFVQDRSGRVANFRINNLDIASRMTRGGGGAVRAAGARFTFLTSYRSVQRGVLFVSVRVESGAKALLVNMDRARYRGPTGNEGFVVGWGGPRTLGAHSHALVFSAFDGSRPGGIMTIDGCINGCNDRWKIRISTKNDP